MKRKRGRKPAGKKAAPASAAAESPSPDTPSSPSTEATNSTPDQAEEDSAPPATQAPVPAPEPPQPAAVVAPPPHSEPPQKPAAPVNPPVDIPYAKPKVGAVYGRVKLKFKSSKVVDPPPPQQQGSSGAQAPAADAAKSETATVPEVAKEAEAEKAAILTDKQQADGQGSETSDADKEKVVRRVGGIKIKSVGLASIGNNTPDRKADPVDEPPPSKQEAVSENKGTEETVEPRSSQELEEKQSTPERQRDEKELSAALEAIKKVMKMDAAEPFNIPVDPVALGIPDYFDIIDTPMDFGTICKNLERGDKYMNSEDVYKDVQFIWDNCTKYNSKGDYIIELMKRVKKGFMKNWLAAGLYSDVPDSGGNDNTGDEDAKGHSKSKSKNKRRRPGNDRHKSDCICAVCQVTRRKKERDEILAVVDNETAAMDSNTSDQHDMEGNSGANHPGSHDTSSSHEQPPRTDVYKETVEADDSGIRMEDVGKFSSDRPSSLPHPDYDDEGSRQHFEGKEQVEYRDMNSNGEHTSTQPNEYSDVENHQQKAQIETSQEVEMEEDYPMLQLNPAFQQLCASLFPSNPSSTFGVRHSLFRPRRRAPMKESPLHAAMAELMKRR
ncbi:hypothetical protein SEVIR_6G008500v4 [Setaria viridis]|uniref:Bromo domain-containing protein n=1 Tax=Setaria viridis TaxID=4556 RepID=A0A4V6D4W1_SETVI|nr:bromodomain-containing factor 2 [Setaria viridis]TKW08126.1 hypothetical protein SEVIR_6G008500v2 [Setaria viridis]